MTEPEYDLVVFGASSFVGQLLTRYLAESVMGRVSSLRWAIAGRSQAKLENVKQSLGEMGKSLPIIVADALSEGQLKALAAKTRVVVSTVGPYALYGEPLVKVCAESGIDYCDLTGEAQWIRRMIDRYEASARQSGARIVHCCGFDSVPSDMGVFFLQQEAKRRWGMPASQIKMRVETLKGGASGGTLASMINIIQEAAADRALRAELADPYSLCPRDHEFRGRQPRAKGAEFDADFGEWTAPFIMAAINERIVHRTNALGRCAYGSQFIYDEAILTGAGILGRVIALSIAAGLVAFIAGCASQPVAGLLKRYVLPKPGEGPSPEEQIAGRYDIRFVGRNGAGQILRVRVTGDSDPGYLSTSKILGQAAISLACDYCRDGIKVGPAGGFWTPAAIFDERFIQRLTDHAGLRFQVIDQGAT